MNERLIVFVHGWGTTNTSSYGGLPERLQKEARAVGLSLKLRHVYLGRYVSFRDEVRVADVSRAFASAVDDVLRSELEDGGRFACITHSTGAPVIRDWWHRDYVERRGGVCPMSHLVMLAPANFGSALAQLGKGRIGRLKSWLGGVEPGTGILDWLELGSQEAWALNSSWVDVSERRIAANGVFPFVLTGQTIDRRLYDHLNSYTGETGSDGVVRVAAANLNTRRITLTQEPPRQAADGTLVATRLQSGAVQRAPQTALRIIAGASHAGSRSGIMRSVRRKPGDSRGAELIPALLECLTVETRADYRALVAAHAAESAAVQERERLEVERRILPGSTLFVHDRYSMVIFRVVDDFDEPVNDFDLVLTAGSDSDPNALPRGFFVDRQLNSIAPNTLTYFLNFDVMQGAPAIVHEGKVVRRMSSGAAALGIRVQPRPSRGFVHYLPCEISATSSLLRQVLQPNSTTMVEIRLRRVVKKNVFRLGKLKKGARGKSFKDTPPGTDIAE